MRGLLVATLLIALAVPVAAEPAQMEIEAKTTEYNGQLHTYTVAGGVTIRLKDMVVTCDRATIYANAKEDRVERVAFYGGVEAKRGSNVFRGETVTYYLPERRLVAEGGTKTRLALPTK